MAEIKLSVMRNKLFFLVIAALFATTALAQEKFSFVIEGTERVYNQVRVVNRTSLPNIQCRVVVLDQDDHILSVYGMYNLRGYDDADSNTNRINRGTKIGLQFPEDFSHDLLYSVEYKDYPLFDAVQIVLYDKTSDFSPEF